MQRCAAGQRFFKSGIVGSYSLQKEVKPTIPDLKNVTQYNSTDWDFLLCRAEANGQVVIVTDGKVVVTQPDIGDAPVVSVKFGNTLLELDAEIDARLFKPLVIFTDSSLHSTVRKLPFLRILIPFLITIPLNTESFCER